MARGLTNAPTGNTLNLEPVPVPPDQGAMLAQMAQQQALGSTLADSDPQAQGPVIPAAVEPLPADVLYRYYQAWESAKDAEIHEQYVARRYYHNKQWTDAEVKTLRRRKQPPVSQNLIRPKVDFLVGVEQRLRRDVKAYARTPEHDDDAWIATAGLRFVEDKTKWPKVASDAMTDALISGIGVIWQGLERRGNKVDICKRHVAADRFFYDPRSEKWDFSDARYLGVHQWLDIDEALELLPHAAEMIEAMAGSGLHGAGGVSLPSLWEKDKNWIDVERRRIYVIEIHYKHKGQWLYDYLCGPISLLPAEQTDRMSPYLDEEDETCHPYLAWSPYVDERGDRYGVVRDLISPQDEVNKRRSKMLHMISVRQTMAERGAVADVDEMKRELAKPDGHVEITPGMGANFQILDQSAQIQGQIELLMESKAYIAERGPNPALAGQGVEGQSGRAILAQQNSGMTELSPVFERCREWKLAAFRKDWCLVRQFWTGERWIRITGNDDAPQFLGLNQITVDPQTGAVAIRNDITRIDVDLILEEGPDTITLQEELLEQLAQLGPGVVPPQVLIELSNVKDKQKLLRMLNEHSAPPPELVAMQERMAKLEAMLKAAQIDKTVADAEAKRADALAKTVEAGLMPQDFAALPFRYREPGEVERLAAALDQGAAPPGGPAPVGPPGPPGADPAALAGPPGPSDPRMLGEPRLNEAGGLPMSNAPPGVPMQ